MGTYNQAMIVHAYHTPIWRFFFSYLFLMGFLFLISEVEMLDLLKLKLNRFLLGPLLLLPFFGPIPFCFQYSCVILPFLPYIVFSCCYYSL
jgi:hypothetical protein